MAFVALVLHGEASVRGGNRLVALKAPPGPAMIAGENIVETEPSATHLDKLPAWATEQPVTDLAKQLRAAVMKLRQLGISKGIDPAIDELLKSKDMTERRVAVNVLGALDELPRLGQALLSAQHPDVWDNGVLALRHWIGRGPGQDLKLYQALIDKAGFKPNEAQIFLNLLHSFSDADLAHPETYETLIDYLESDRVPIRAMAAWHLARVAPAGKAFKYNPLAPQEDRDRAVKEWRKLIPRGKLPPKAKPQGNG
jgi:hypothetical protein